MQRTRVEDFLHRFTASNIHKRDRLNTHTYTKRPLSHVSIHLMLSLTAKRKTFSLVNINMISRSTFSSGGKQLWTRRLMPSSANSPLSRIVGAVPVSSKPITCSSSSVVCVNRHICVCICTFATHHCISSPIFPLVSFLWSLSGPRENCLQNMSRLATGCSKVTTLGYCTPCVSPD